MSRNQLPSSSSRYKISSPQPYIPPEHRSPAENGSHLPIQPSSSRPNAPSQPPGPSGTSPARPARSRMRDQPPPPAPMSRRDLAPLLTQDQRRPSASSVQSHDALLSPITPLLGGDSPAGRSVDPFAADRSQRSELRAQAVVQQANPPHPGGSGGEVAHKLRNVVGAFMSAGKGKDDSIRRPTRRAREDDHTNLWQVDDGGKFGELDRVLKEIRKDWPFALESDFSPSTLALSLLSDSTSTQSTLPAFLSIHESLSSALQASVQAHFQTFAASLPAHASYLSTLARAQGQIKASKDTLREARDGFGGKGKAELESVRLRERQLRDMLQLLDTIDHLKQVPDRLEGLIGDKKFIQAALLLVESSKTIQKPEIAAIGAVSDLKAYLIAQEITLKEILIEELHNHLYLKTFNSDSRWRSYVPGQVDFLVNDLDMPGYPRAEQSSRLSLYLLSLVDKPTDYRVLDSDSTSLRNRSSRQDVTAMSSSTISTDGTHAESLNPEENSFRYIETLLESLGVLGRLGSALDTVAQRVTTELHSLVDSTLDEVEERMERAEEDDNPHNGRAHTVFGSAESPSANIQLGGSTRHEAILRDVIWTLYSKLAAVLEGHRVLYEVSRWISARRDFKDSTLRSNGGFNIPVLEVWKPMQQEVRSVLQNYLTDDTQGSSLDRHAIMTVNEVLRDGKLARDRQRPMFRFADTDLRVISPDIKPVDESIHKSLKASVPGLIGTQQGDLSNPLDDNLASNGKHRNLIPANPFNVTTLFQPTVAFINKASSIAPSGFEEEPKAFGAVLEDFVVRVFLPQLDERVTASFQQAVSGYDAYQLDSRLVEDADKPPLKSSVRVMNLIHSLCSMLHSTPFHRENYSRLIVGVIVQYYQQCSSRFKELATKPDTIDQSLALPATLAQKEDLINCITDVRAVASADHNESVLTGQKEIKLETELIGDQPILESQLINSNRKLEALCYLSQSLRWYIDALLDIQDVAEEPFSPDGEAPNRIVASFAALKATSDNSAKNVVARLPLTKAMAQRYEAIVQTYEQLAEMILNTLRLEIRCRVMCNLNASLRKGNFRLESEALEPDPDIVDLAGHLTQCASLANRALSTADEEFIFRGLGQLVDHMFIQGAKFITVVNITGVRKIKRNILALQQTLRAMRGVNEGVLYRSIQYWDMYETGPRAMLETLHSSKPLFTFDDYNTMLNLQCKADQAEAHSSELNTYLIDLHALSMSIEGWEIGEL